MPTVSSRSTGRRASCCASAPPRPPARCAPVSARATCGAWSRWRRGHGCPRAATCSSRSTAESHHRGPGPGNRGQAPYSASMTPLGRRLAVARGDEPADLVIRGGRVLSVFTREWLRADVAIADGWIAGVGDYRGRETLDASGMWVVPGLIDAHVHIESSRLLPDEFARLVLPHGTTTVVADPHEIANVLGTDGAHWLLDSTEGLPLDVFFMASSCVPASGFESPRRPLTPGDLEGLLRRRRVLGLAEMMNFPGVIGGSPPPPPKIRPPRAGDRRGPPPGAGPAAAPA